MITNFGSRGSGFANQDTEIILIGGGTARFTDRPSILGADYAFTPIYREIATFTLPSTASGTPMERCLEPHQPGKGYWIAQDRRFGYGLNIPRTRHASEILKAKDLLTNETKHTIWVFGGYNL